MRIVGAPDLMVPVGGQLNLSCLVQQPAEEPQFTFWFRNGRIVNYELEAEQRAKLSMWRSSQRPDTTTSQLLIFAARPADAGNYTCQPSGARPSSIFVHVLQGKSPSRPPTGAQRAPD